MTAGVLHLTKHHGLGNDFLVLLEPGDVDAGALARYACDRHRGVGADGLLIAHPGTDGADVTMELRNADGSRAEMSGNGIRCFAQAVWEDGLESRADLVVATDVGIRVVRRIGPLTPGAVRAAVDMGPAKVIADAPEWVSGTIERAALVDVGNPHLVLLDPNADEADIETVGPAIESTFPDGINVEWVRAVSRDRLVLRVWERGVGVTQACGTGSCAVAAAAVSWGVVDSPVVVRNPGGDVTVTLGDTATLTGPAVRVAAVELAWP
jgi:diaminopimelate epimerase